MASSMGVVAKLQDKAKRQWIAQNLGTCKPFSKAEGVMVQKVMSGRIACKSKTLPARRAYGGKQRRNAKGYLIG